MNFQKEVLVSTEHLYSVEITCRCGWMLSGNNDYTLFELSIKKETIKMHQRKCTPLVHHPRCITSGPSTAVHHPRCITSCLLPAGAEHRPFRSSPPCASWRSSHSYTLTLLHSHTLCCTLKTQWL